MVDKLQLIRKYSTWPLILITMAVISYFWAPNAGNDLAGDTVLNKTGQYGKLGQGEKKASYKVTKIVDGDTIEISYKLKTEQVRFIGINTPEFENSSADEYATLAESFLERLLSDQRVVLEFDSVERDKYGRLLAYVFTDQGTFVNAELVKQGFAQVMTVKPNVKYRSLFTILEKQAWQSRKGLWGIGKYRMEHDPPEL